MSMADGSEGPSMSVQLTTPIMDYENLAIRRKEILADWKRVEKMIYPTKSVVTPNFSAKIRLKHIRNELNEVNNAIIAFGNILLKENQILCYHPGKETLEEINRINKENKIPTTAPGKINTAALRAIAH